MEKQIFIAYKRAGEDDSKTEVILRTICESLKVAGLKDYCSFWNDSFYKENNFSLKDILLYAFDRISESDYVLAIVQTPEKSEGMLLEIGYALAQKKKVILAIRKDVPGRFLPEMAEKVITFVDLDDLYKQLENLKTD